MDVWMIPVVVLFICPDLFKRVQNLQLDFGQKENPLRCVLPGFPIGPGILVGIDGRDVLLADVLSFRVNSSMDLCFVFGFGTAGTIGGGGLAASVAAKVTMVGSAASSPGWWPTFALQSRSLRFFG